MEANFEAVVDGVDKVETVKARAKLLVGCDGLWSQVRKQLVGPKGDEPRDLYLNTWNAVVPTEANTDLNLHESNEINYYHFAAQSKLCYLCDSGKWLALRLFLLIK